ncbi:gamma-glutamylcyclotransferase [Kitasatospora nipponensis]|uniref:Gamma-glutamylcyclotransferase n=1 Tax=Kitasatospora nipponensis TaxID=258049 RepID=A0ABP4GNU7_9ACTN
MLPFFVYGTLRPGLHNHARHLGGRCLRSRPAVLGGAVLHDGPGYPYAVRDPDPRRLVHGELLTVRPADYARVLAELDELEECRPDDSGLYVRLRLPVRPTGGAATATGSEGLAGPAGPVEDAWVYLAGPAQAEYLRAHPSPIPSGDWTTHLAGTPERP